MRRIKQHCFGEPMGDCQSDATSLCGLCDGHYCDRCIGPHYDAHETVAKKATVPPNPATEQRAEEALREAHTTCGCGCSCTVELACGDCADHHYQIHHAFRLAMLAQAEKMITLYEERFDREGLRAMRDEAERLRKERI